MHRSGLFGPTPNHCTLQLLCSHESALLAVTWACRKCDHRIQSSLVKRPEAICCSGLAIIVELTWLTNVGYKLCNHQAYEPHTAALHSGLVTACER